MKCLRAFAGLLLLFGAASVRAEPPAAPAIRIALASPEQVVLGPEAPVCPERDDYGFTFDLPDAPVRAYRLPGGRIRVLAAHYDNLAYDSRDLSHFERRDCTSLYRSHKSADPAAYADREWLIAAYPMADGSVFGLVHDEYWGGTHDEACRRRLGARDPWESVCVYINLTGTRSFQAAPFVRLPGEAGLVAVRQERFANGMDRVGFRDPSNILFNPRDGYYYLEAYADARGHQTMGSCVFRTHAPLSAPWLGWDGKAFAARMGSPYAARPAGDPPICQPTTPLNIASIVYHPRRKLFIALGHDLRVDGIYYMTSPDLIHWSRPVTLLRAKALLNWQSSDPDPVIFASLIDPASASPGFDTTGDSPWLYLVRAKVGAWNLNARRRDIVRLRLAITGGAPGD